MGDLQHVHPPGRERRQHVALRVGGQQHGRDPAALSRVTSALSLGLPVGQPRGRARRRPQDVEAQARRPRSSPPRAGAWMRRAALGSARCTRDGQPAPPSTTSRGWYAAMTGGRRALVVGLRVREHQRVEPLDAGLLEPLQDRPVGRAGVHQHRGAVELDQRRVALPDVQEREHELARAAARQALPSRCARRPARSSPRNGATQPAPRAPPDRPAPAGSDPTAAAASPIAVAIRARAGQRRSPGARWTSITRDRRRAGDVRHVAAGRRSSGAVRAENGVASGAATCAATDGEHPEPHHRRDRRRGQQVRRQRRQRHLLEVQRHQRRGPERRRDRDRGGVGDGLRHPALERLAQRRGADEQRRDRGERQLPPRLVRRPRVERQRHRRGEQQRVPAPRRAPRERGHQPRDAHHPRALDRRPAARERDVERDHRRGQHEPRPQRHADQRAQPQDERGQQHHVAARRRPGCARARTRWKSSRTSSLSRSSSPSTIPRSSAASGGASPRSSPASARRRTPSSAPATPAAPFSAVRHARTPRAPRARCAGADRRPQSPSGATRPRTARCRRHRTPPRGRERGARPAPPSRAVEEADPGGRRRRIPWRGPARAATTRDSSVRPCIEREDAGVERGRGARR